MIRCVRTFMSALRLRVAEGVIDVAIALALVLTPTGCLAPAVVAAVPLMPAEEDESGVQETGVRAHMVNQSRGPARRVKNRELLITILRLPLHGPHRLVGHDVSTVRSFCEFSSRLLC